METEVCSFKKRINPDASCFHFYQVLWSVSRTAVNTAVSSPALITQAAVEWINSSITFGHYTSSNEILQNTWWPNQRKGQKLCFFVFFPAQKPTLCESILLIPVLISLFEKRDVHSCSQQNNSGHDQITTRVQDHCTVLVLSNRRELATWVVMTLQVI